MTKELAEQLTKAGWGKPIIVGFEGFREMILSPSLGELIEACGSKFYSLVYAMENDWRCFSERDGDYIDTADGATPIEAVAKLWLALHN